MNIENKTPKEIQQLLFEEIRNGADIEKLRVELKEKGLHPEGFYFTTEAEHTKVMEEPRSPAGQLSGWQIFAGIITIVVLIIKVARCSSKM